MRKQLIVFDLDGTLAESKLPISIEMGKLLCQLLDRCQVGILGGLTFAEFKTHVVDKLTASSQQLVNLHLLPTDGTAYYRYDLNKNDWQPIYTNEIPSDDKKYIIKTIEQTAKKLGFWEDKTWGEVTEDRASQITFSALGQAAPLDAKKAWDSDGSKRKQLHDELVKLLPNFSVHSAGLTSINVNLAGLDKAVALAKLIDILGIDKIEMVYVGDALAPGGNDAVVKEAGFETLPTIGPSQTQEIIKNLIES